MAFDWCDRMEKCEDGGMSEQPRQELAVNKVGNFLRYVFAYHVVWVLPMTSEMRNRWANTRARGFCRYAGKSTLINILSSSVVAGIVWLIFDEIFDDGGLTLKAYLLFICLGVLNGWVSAYFRWMHNEVEYSKRLRATHS